MYIKRCFCWKEFLYEIPERSRKKHRSNKKLYKCRINYQKDIGGDDSRDNTYHDHKGRYLPVYKVFLVEYENTGSSTSHATR